MNEEQLAEWERLAEAVAADGYLFLGKREGDLIDAVPALIAEVRRLRAELEKLEDEAHDACLERKFYDY
jgi:hypothetical protein